MGMVVVLRGGGALIGEDGWRGGGQARGGRYRDGGSGLALVFGLRSQMINMQRFMLKSKIHRATLTGTEIGYEGSISIDEDLIERADLLPGEQVHVLNVSTGDRIITYVIKAPAKSGTVMLNGPAARMGIPGDQLIIISYCLLDDAAIRGHRPVVIHVDGQNRPVCK